MPAVSKKQQKFFGIVRAIQKGEQAPTTPETAKAAADMKKGDVKKFASTKHKGLPNKVVQKEEKNGDHEPDMIRSQLKTAGRASKRIEKHTRKKENFKAWVQSKITKASDYLDTAADYLDSKDMKEESNPRIPRKKGQPAGSKKHSDLYTDENPKGTIQGLGFKDVATAKASVSKIRSSSRSHAHKIQAAVAMEQRAREMGKTSEAAVYRKFINTMKKKTKAMNEEGLRAWFGKSSGTTKSGRKVKGWVQVGGKYDGKPCARQPGQKTTPKCTSSSKRASMSDKERDSAARRKRAADPGQPQKTGAAAPTNVSTDPKKKMKENISFAEAKDKKGKGSGTKDACYHKVKSRYSVWPSAYASGALVKCRKVGAANWGNSTKEEFVKDGISFHQFQEKCWKGYEKKGMKTMFGKRYPNCVKKEETEVVNEVSDKLKKSYIKGATKEIDNLRKTKMTPMGMDSQASDKVLKRKVNIGKTMSKLKEDALDEACWKGYEKKGMKKMFGKMYPNCVKKKTKSEEVEYVDEAKYEAGASTYGKASIRNKRAYGYGGNAKPPAERGAAITRRTDEHKARRNVKKGNKYGSPDRYKPTVDGAPSDEFKKNRYVTKEDNQVQEKMDLKKADMGDVVKDFYKSDAPQFKGRSKEKRREMAIAAKLTAEKGKLPEAANPAQQAAIAIAKKERKQDLKVAKKRMKDGKYYEEEVVTELNRFEKEKGMDTKTGKPVTKGGTAKSDKALQFVMKKIGKQRMGGNQPKKVRGAKNPNETSPTKQKMTRMKAAKASSRAFETRAKRSGYKTAQDYANVVARYGSEDNMKKGRGLGT